MRWMNWVIIVLIGLNAVWMTFDGARALIVGDFITPSSGEYAGQLGPWSKIVKIFGINPRSSLMKLIFLGYGLTALVFLVCFALNLSWAWWGIVVVAILGLWYLPIGTAINVVVLILLVVSSLLVN